MYMDSYVAAGLVIVLATCTMLGYVAFYAYRHIRQDIADHDHSTHSVNTENVTVKTASAPVE